ncbi:hypothetical protein [Craterilacuibacter sinensis]|uniref:Uncharacterized protein n=1 Tax=Craterilacuibacter sinensis TaxID=2686017 RepID=A0A845BMN8_9NEIS|nr:hypothetical protein [Craterilacuibacter sinensis]MXR36660.1 hypothetical protein [Craterilacuibacter sinensis]
MPDYTVIDSTKVLDGHYLKKLFWRAEPLKNEVSACKWLWLTAVEIVFGKEILEHMVINASVASVGNHPHVKDHGKIMHLSRHIPAGIVTNLFRKHIVEVLYYKFYRQYGILSPEESPYPKEGKRIIDCSQNRFCVDKTYLEQFISFRRAYDFSWLIINILTDAIIYFVSSDLTLAMLSALVVEAFRRFLKA